MAVCPREGSLGTVFRGTMCSCLPAACLCGSTGSAQGAAVRTLETRIWLQIVVASSSQEIKGRESRRREDREGGKGKRGS